MKAMCGTRNTFAKQEVKWFAGLQEVRGRDVLWVTADEFRKAFPSEPRGFNYDFNQLTPIQSGRTYAIASVGGNARPITRRVVFTETNKPTKCGAMCRNAKGFLCDCSCKGVNHGAGATFSREGSNDIDLTPTEEMAANAKRGLELRRKHGRGGTAVGVARARDISNRKTLSPETVRRMHAFFSRHEKNKAGGEDDAGYIAWMLWSGDAGQGWAKRKVEQMDKSENQRSETYKAIAERLGSAATNDRPGAKARFSNGDKNRRLMQVLADADRRIANQVVSNIAKHYGITTQQVFNEIFDAEAEDLMDYVTEPVRSAAYVILQKKGMMSRPGAKAKFGYADAQVVGGDIVWPSGMTLKILSHSTLEQKSKEMQEAIKRNRSAWVADYKLRGPKGATYSLDVYANGTYILTPHNNPRPMLRGQLKAARPGAKAVFATEVGRKGNKAAMITRDGTGTWYAYVVQRGEIGIGPFEEMLGTMRSYATEEKAKRAAIKALDTSGFSRPGAKASFAQDARAVAQEILRQLGGGRFMAMVGGKNAMHGTFGGKPGLQVSIGKGAEGGINRLIVTLDPATDTYNMEFWRIGNRGLSTKKVSEASMVYADDLQRVFTDRTKFYTSMSRPGAKAKMAKWTVTPTQKHGKDIEEHTAKIGRDHWKIDSMPHLGKSVGSLYRWDEMRGLRHISTGNIEQLKRQAEAISTKQDALSDVMRGFSRPGAKEEMAHPDDPFYVGTHRFKVGDVVKTDTIVPRYGKIVRLIRAVNGQPAYVVDNLGNDAKPKQSLGRSQWNDGLLVRASRPGAKDTNAVREGSKISAEDEACLKMMAAANAKVSDKIRTLIAEGKPQKQAVAIALDLKRRGEL